MSDAELRERLDTIEMMLTYIVNSMMAAGLNVAIQEYPDEKGTDEMIAVIEKLSDESAYIMGKYIEDYYTEDEEKEDEN